MSFWYDWKDDLKSHKKIGIFLVFVYAQREIKNDSERKINWFKYKFEISNVWLEKFMVYSFYCHFSLWYKMLSLDFVFYVSCKSSLKENGFGRMLSRTTTTSFWLILIGNWNFFLYIKSYCFFLYQKYFVSCLLIIYFFWVAWWLDIHLISLRRL